jgi:hypothetical protein
MRDTIAATLKQSIYLVVFWLVQSEMPYSVNAPFEELV